MKRQFCSNCLKTVTDYTTRHEAPEYNPSITYVNRAAREAAKVGRVWHTCRKCELVASNA